MLATFNLVAFPSIKLCHWSMLQLKYCKLHLKSTQTYFSDGASYRWLKSPLTFKSTQIAPQFD